MNTLLIFFLFSIPFPQVVKHDDTTEAQCLVSFEVWNAGFKTTGTISATIVMYRFNPIELDQSSVVIMANPSTIHTGIGIRDKHLQRADYFNTAKYPEIKLESRSFKRTGRNQFSGTFQLSIKNKTKEILVPFTKRLKNNRKSYEGAFVIRRSEFGIGEPSMTLADEVLVKFEIH